MNKTKIEWCDDTWNPVTGCLHNCGYCYAKRIANRFGGYSKELASEYQTPIQVFSSCGVIAALERPLVKHTTNGETIAPYPFGFDPTFHRYRLDEPIRKTRPRKIFVCSMADLFGEWVPDEWIQEVFKACEAAPQHKYLFLTKNPRKYEEITNHADNFWYGATATDQGSMESALDSFMQQRVNADQYFNTFLSIEPLLGRIKINPCDGYFSCTDWVIIGAQTGPRAVLPKREWVEHIVNRCRESRIPVFMKNSLKELMSADFVQEWPERLR